jgi:hypothetical protein
MPIKASSATARRRSALSAAPFASGTTFVRPVFDFPKQKLRLFNKNLEIYKLMKVMIKHKSLSPSYLL